MRNDFKPKHLQRAKDNLSKCLKELETQAQHNETVQKEQNKKMTFWERFKALLTR